MPSKQTRSGSCVEKRKAALERIAAVHAESHRRLLALRELLSYAIHKNSCKGLPAFSEEQLARDCDCGLQKIKDFVLPPQGGQQHGDRIKKGKGGQRG